MIFIRDFRESFRDTPGFCNNRRANNSLVSLECCYVVANRTSDKEEKLPCPALVASITVNNRLESKSLRPVVFGSKNREDRRVSNEGRSKLSCNGINLRAYKRNLDTIYSYSAIISILDFVFLSSILFINSLKLITKFRVLGMPILDLLFRSMIRPCDS